MLSHRLVGSSRGIALSGVALAALAFGGCQGKPPAPVAEPDEHEHALPKTLAEAHHQLEEMSGEIKAAFEEGAPEKAHDALHEIGHVIEALPDLAKEAGVEVEDEVAQAKDDLMDGFMRLDDVLHDRGETAWADVSESVEAALAKVESWLPEGAEHEEHAHAEGDAHDHDE